MTRELTFVVIAAVAVLALAAMWWGWRRRTKRDRAIVAPTAIPEGGTETATYEGFYVATTRHDAPLERLAIRHLAFRGRVTVRMRTDGMILEIPGEPAVFLAAGDVRGVGRATWTIDRVVETGGLVVVSWQASTDTVADTYLRIAEESADAFVAAATALNPRQTSNGSDQ